MTWQYCAGMRTSKGIPKAAGTLTIEFAEGVKYSGANMGTHTITAHTPEGDKEFYIGHPLIKRIRVGGKTVWKNRDYKK